MGTLLSATNKLASPVETAGARELGRLATLFDRLRSKLLDMRLSNPMLNYKHTATSKRQIRIVDAIPEQVYRMLATETGALDVVPLPEPEGIPADEQTEVFRAALDHAKVADIDYLAESAALEEVGRDDEFALAEAEARLRVRLRQRLGLPPRPNRKTINPVELAKTLGIDPSTDLKAKTEKTDRKTRKLQTLKWPDTLEALLEKIAGDAGLAEQEMGLSTLFLSFGFLEWAESKDAGKRLFAPLLLLPVKLTRRKTDHGKIVFALTATASAAEDNHSLAKKLLDDFGLEPPKFEPDENALDPLEDYFAAIGKLAAEQPGWRIRRWLTLGHFAFGRLAMYADLDPVNWKTHPAADPLAGAVLRGTEIVGDGGVGLVSPPEDYEVDRPEIENIAPFLIQDADSSQHSAIIDVMSGKNLVIQGPPGTGKSQTIANVIANALAAGKKVLFLAEKMAALDVVKHRLDMVGLGEFCLEMHSDKASPKNIIQSLKSRHQLGYESSRDPIRPDQIWEEARQNIAAYVHALHTDTDVGRAFDQFWRGVRTQSEHGDLASVFPKTAIPKEVLDSTNSFDAALSRLRQYVTARAAFDKSFGAFEHSSWTRLKFPADVNPGMTYGLVAAIRNLKETVVLLSEELKKVAEYGLASATDVETASKVDSFLPSSPPPDNWIVALVDHEPQEVRALMARIANFDAHIIARTRVDGFNADNAAQCAAANAVLTNLAPHQFGQRPAETYFEARATVGAFALLRQALDTAEPALAALGLGKDFPAAAVCSVRNLAELVERTPDAFRAFVFANSRPSAEAYSAIRAEWQEVNAGETRWRARFRSVGRSWPSPDMLIQAAQATGAKSGLTGLLSKLGPKPKIVVQVNELLGLPATVEISREDLVELASHVHRLRQFSANRAHQLLFGALWRDLDTQVDEIGACLNRYHAFHETLIASSWGEEVLRLVGAVDEEWLDRLVTCGKSLAFWSRLDAAALRVVGKASIGELGHSLLRRSERSKSVLGADPDGLIESVDATWSLIGRAIADARTLTELRNELNEHRLSNLVQSLRDEPDNVAKTLEWHSSVERAPIGDALRMQLRAQGAGLVRLRISEVAINARGLLTRAMAEIRSIRDEFGVSGLSIDHLTETLDLLNRLAQMRDELGQFLSVLNARAGAEEKGLEAFLQQSDRLGIAIRLLPSLFEGLVAQRRGERIRQRDPILSRVSGQQLESSRDEFRTRDQRKKERDRKVVFNRLIEKRPLAGSNFGPKRTWTEAAKLNNEFGKQTGLRPLRELMSHAGKSIQEMKPCFLMSPLSLAKFVPAEALSFDLLVIDEASQMRPEDALGGLLRARQLVVVGDPKQLPPTDFFRRAMTELASDENDSESEGDDESILEACHKTFRQLRQLRLLRWHYRSRCESLIAFSNKEIYAPEGRRLITFPAARVDSFSIDRIRVQGAFDDGRNPPEAQRIAEEAVRFMREHAERDAPPSLGLVAMNAKQTELVEEELRFRTSGDDAVEKYRDKVGKRGEPVFVKNLENVQGDERDFILISLTYGPKLGETAVLQRFGPILGKHGHRRLNVLFTRARIRIGLVTSMDSDDVKPSETASRGVHLLKSYLAYVESAGRGSGSVTGREPDSDFEIHVARALKDRGHKVVCQVGVSGFRIDLAVSHPGHDEHFLAGIECDGAQYHSSKSARDRDRLRQEVLEGLGWTILRVWSTDWFDNPDLQARLLDEKLKELAAAKSEPSKTYAFARDGRVAADAGALNTGKAPPTAEAKPKGEPVQNNAPNDANNPPGRPGVQPTPPPVDRGPKIAVRTPDFEPWRRESFTPTEARAALIALRDHIASQVGQKWEPERSILREGLIEAFTEQRVTDKREWLNKVPLYLRKNTSPAEMRYFEDICEVVARIRW